MKLFGRGTRNMRLLECLSLLGISTVVLGCDEVFGLQETRDIRPQPCGWDLQVGPDSRQVITSVANGGNDRVVFGGIFEDNLDFGVEAAQETGPGAFVGEVNFEGQLTWTQPIRLLDNLRPPWAATLSNGATILAGASANQVNCGSVDLSNSSGSAKIYMCEFASAGNPANTMSHMCSGTGEQTLGGIVRTELGKSFVLVGGFTDKMNCGKVADEIADISGSTDIFVYKLHESGLVEWAKSFGGEGVQFATAVAVNDTGEVFLAGQYKADLAFPGGNNLAYDMNNYQGEHDIFVAKLSGTDGNHRWSRRFGVGGDDRVTGIALGPEGAIYVVGTTDGKIGSYTANSSTDYFIRQLLESKGNVVTEGWTRGFASAGIAEARMSVAVNPHGDVIVSGTFGGLMTSMEDFTLTTKSQRDTFIAVFSKENQPVWHKQWPTNSGNEIHSALAAHASGSITWGGAFASAEPVDFGCELRKAQGTDGILVNILP